MLLAYAFMGICVLDLCSRVRVWPWNHCASKSFLRVRRSKKHSSSPAHWERVRMRTPVCTTHAGRETAKSESGSCALSLSPKSFESATARAPKCPSHFCLHLCLRRPGCAYVCIHSHSRLSPPTSVSPSPHLCADTPTVLRTLFLCTDRDAWPGVIFPLPPQGALTLHPGAAAKWVLRSCTSKYLGASFSNVWP